MLVIPVIDIIGGKCVRLTQGDYSTKKVYSDDPFGMTMLFRNQGAEMIHVIDLDGAKCGKPVNADLVIKMKKAVGLMFQVGGGIRSVEAAKMYLNSGIDRIIIGTKALEKLSFVSDLIDEYGSERIVVSVDIRDGKVALRGWQTLSDCDYADFAANLKTTGVKNILCTDISKDGSLDSPDLKLFEVLMKIGFKVVAAGGISNVETILKLKKIGVFGAVLGKALYEKKIVFKDVLLAVRDSELTGRIIPCLDVKDGRVVKGVNFKNLNDAGDPVELAKKYYEEGADELVFLDISASSQKRGIVLDMVKSVAKNIFIPFTVGGGIRNIDDIREVLLNGADKVSLNTAAVENPSLISEAAKTFGSQCIVVAIDVKKTDGKYKVFIKGGKEGTSKEAVSWAKEVVKLGAGEILLTSMDRDGTKSGFDNEILRIISDNVDVPVIASGGAGKLGHIRDAFLIGKADAVLAASVFHYDKYSMSDVKQYLKSFNIPVRL